LAAPSLPGALARHEFLLLWRFSALLDSPGLWVLGRVRVPFVVVAVWRPLEEL